MSSGCASLTAQNNVAKSANALTSSITRLSSGLRINSADAAAGLALSDRMTAQVNGLNRAARNANDGISLAQTADGALSAVSDNLQLIRKLKVQSANATNSSSDRASLQLEVMPPQSEIDRVATQTQFNGTNLLDGSFTVKAFQVGGNAGQTITVASIDRLGIGPHCLGGSRRIGIRDLRWNSESRRRTQRRCPVNRRPPVEFRNSTLVSRSS